MTAALPQSQVIAEESNLVRRIGFYSLLAFVFFFNSGVADFGRIYFLHLPLVFGLTAGGCALLAGTLLPPFRTRVGVCYIALTFWFALGLPFSFWRGGSVAQFQSWMRVLVIWAFFVGLTASYRECKLLLNTIVAASVTAALGGSSANVESAGRLSLDIGRFSNPNYLALTLIIALPFVWRLYSSGGPRKLIALVAGALIMVAAMKTGSRAALYAVGVMMLVAFLRANVAQKLRLCAAAGIAVLVFSFMVPSYLKQRYMTFSSTDSEYDTIRDAGVAESAAESTRQRQHLFFQSLEITVKHPLLGIGLGTYAPYVNQWNKEMGRPKEPWLGTHNTYTQISSEAGIPAFLLFVAILVMSWRSLNRVIRITRGDRRPAIIDIRNTALAAQVCLTAFCFSLMFIHIAFDFLPHMIIGAALIIGVSATREIQRLNTQPQPAPANEFAGFPAYGRPAILIQQAR